MSVFFELLRSPRRGMGTGVEGRLKMINRKTGVGSLLSESLIQTSRHLGEGKSGSAALLS